MKSTIPLFYFPSTVCWIDDDQLFLDSINLSFGGDYKSTSFSCTDIASKYFSTYQATTTKIPFIKEYTDCDIYGTGIHFPTDLNLTDLQKLEQNHEISNEISVLVVDYSMPKANGLDICKDLKDMPFKKILLTGQASSKDAIDAFNLGLIDQFIQKDLGLSTILHAAVKRLSYQYFCERSENLLSHIDPEGISPLSDPIFVEFFKIWREENNITEFYLINKQGSFLTKNQAGVKSYFIVMSDDDKDTFVKFNDDSIDKTEELLALVSKDNMIPFFGPGKEYWNYDFCEWKEHFYHSKIIQGKRTYYWATVPFIHES